VFHALHSQPKKKCVWGRVPINPTAPKFSVPNILTVAHAPKIFDVDGVLVIRCAYLDLPLVLPKPIAPPGTTHSAPAFHALPMRAVMLALPILSVDGAPPAMCAPKDQSADLCSSLASKGIGCMRPRCAPRNQPSALALSPTVVAHPNLNVIATTTLGIK